MLIVALLGLFPAAAQAKQTFSRALRCGPAGAARLSGALRATVGPHVRVTRARRARASVTLRGSADLRLQASAGASCRLEPTPVGAWNAPPARFLVGAVPVVVVPRITLYVSAESRATQPIVTRMHGSMAATAGLRYDGHVHRIGRFSQHFVADPPSGRAHGSVAARITPSVELLLYGEAGPRFDFSTGLEFDSGPPRGLSAPVELSAGLSFPGLHVGPYTVLSRTIPLRSWAPVASEGALERARIEWDSAADVDLHVWDESGRHTWFRESGIPGVLLSRDDTDGFGPETLVEDEPSGRELTYGLCDFDDRGAGGTMVTARVTDAAGGARTSSAMLRSEGDSLVLGGGYNPPAGWCQPRH